jgi:epoxyqueuosine reductase
MSCSPEADERLEQDPVRFVKQEITEWTRSDPCTMLPFLDNYCMYEEPLIEFADGDDPIFAEYKGIIGTVHLTPREALARTYDKRPGEMPARLSVISYAWPFTEKTRVSQRGETRIPGRLYSHTRWYGKQANMALQGHVVELLTRMGYLAAAPEQLPFFDLYRDEKGLYSNWSQRHMLYAAGLGTFGLSDLFITERGVCHNCGAIVTNLPLPPSPRTATDPYGNCLFYQGVNCRACMRRCPSGAITEAGHDKNICQRYVDEYGEAELSRIEQGQAEYDNDTTLGGCGLSMVGVPCEYRNPTKKRDRESGIPPNTPPA